MDMPNESRVWLLVAPQSNCDALPEAFSTALFEQGAPPCMIVSLEGQGYTGKRAVLIDPENFERIASRAPDLYSPEYVLVLGIPLADDPFRTALFFAKQRIEKEIGLQIMGHPVPA